MINNMDKKYEEDLEEFDELVQENKQKEKVNTEKRESIEKAIDSLVNDSFIKSMLEITDNELVRQKDEIEVEKEELLNRTKEYQDSIEKDEIEAESDSEILKELENIGIDVSISKSMLSNCKEKILFYKEQLRKIQELLEGNGEDTSAINNYSFHWNENVNHTMEHERGNEEHPRNELKVKSRYR